MGRAMSFYDGFLDMSTERDLFDDAVSFDMAVVYTENRGFENLKTEYFVATCIAAALLIFSCIPILYVVSVKYLGGQRQRPGSNLMGKIKYTGDGRVLAEESQFDMVTFSNLDYMGNRRKRNMIWREFCAFKKTSYTNDDSEKRVVVFCDILIEHISMHQLKYTNYSCA